LTCRGKIASPPNSFPIDGELDMRIAVIGAGRDFASALARRPA
jgi:hypothetical protein